MVKEFVKGKRYLTSKGKVIIFAFFDEDNDPMFEMVSGFIESTDHKGYFGFTLESAKRILTELPDEAV